MRDDEDAVDKVNEILKRNNTSLETVRETAQVQRAKELVQGYGRREPDAVRLVDKLLSSKGSSMDALLASAPPDMLDDIARIERLAAIAESRRNNSLREVERRRAVSGQALRSSVQEIEDAEFEEVIKTPTKRKDAA